MTFFDVLRGSPELRGLSLCQIISFTRLSSVLKNEIVLCQPSNVTRDAAPAVLSPAIVLFLANTVDISPDSIPYCWDKLKDEIWEQPAADPLTEQEEDLFRKHGWKIGISRLFIACD
jgi:hypothetical protein